MDVNIRASHAELSFKTEDGKRKAWEVYYPYFYASCKADAEVLAETIRPHPKVESATVQKRFGRICSSEKEQVIKICVNGQQSARQVALDVRSVPGIAGVAELTMPQYFKYMIMRDVEFFAKYEVETDAEGRLVKIGKLAAEILPEFSCAALYGGKKGEYFLLTGKGDAGGKAYSLFELPQALSKIDVDFLFSFGGYTILERTGKYQQTGLGCFLPGCVHLDLERDFRHDIYREGNDPATAAQLLDFGKKRIPRIVELSRASGARPDLISRITPGRLNTYIHAKTAKQKGYVIPDAKLHAERPKSLRELLAVDRGGLIIYPPPGLYRNVGKCDFASMYPSIMVNYNISPETLRCGCCKDADNVPGAGWHFCKKQQGIVSTGIKAVLQRRLLLKALMRRENDPEKKAELDARQKALKNILVTCFGYLGYNNFVFSNVECKESVILYGRELLQQAVGIAGDMGLEALYGIVDSVFVAGGTKDDYEEYCTRVSKAIGITLELDEMFRAIAFPESVTASSAANRYYAMTFDGRIEARGITVRRSDAFPLAAKFQLEAIPMLLADRQWEESVEEATSLLESIVARLYRGEFEVSELVVARSVRESPADYAVLPDSAKAFWQEPNDKFESRFVHTVHGPRPESKARRENVDCRKYRHMISLTLAELVRGIGKN